MSSAIAHPRDDGLGPRRGACAQSDCLYDWARTPRHRNRRLLVDVGRHRDAVGSGSASSASVGYLQRRKRPGDNPLGSFLGQYIGWRGAFFSVVPLAALALVWQSLTLPPMPSSADASRAGSLFRILRGPRIFWGMVAVAFFFMGQFALFAYVRPFLETVTRVNASTLSLLLLIMGTAGLLGTYLIGVILKTRLYSVLIAMPLAMAMIAVAPIAFGGSVIAVAGLLAGWGLIGTAAPVGWWTWLSKMLPRDAESRGGLMAAVIQLAITLGATVGGLFYDLHGYRSTFDISAAILCASAVLAYIGWRTGPLISAEGRSPRPAW
jgi:predicted MFS family arabinose efflux permease